MDGTGENKVDELLGEAWATGYQMGLRDMERTLAPAIDALREISTIECTECNAQDKAEIALEELDGE
jgi:hypothetical protein